VAGVPSAVLDYVEDRRGRADTTLTMLDQSMSDTGRLTSSGLDASATWTTVGDGNDRHHAIKAARQAWRTRGESAFGPGSDSKRGLSATPSMSGQTRGRSGRQAFSPSLASTSRIRAVSTADTPKSRTTDVSVSERSKSKRTPGFMVAEAIRENRGLEFISLADNKFPSDEEVRITQECKKRGLGDPFV